MKIRVLQAVSGPIPVTELGLVLPHEHLFTDLRGPDTPGYAVGDPEVVADVMEPFLQEAFNAGVTALVECSTGGVGRNIPVLKRLSTLTPIKIIAPTGVYREAYVPASYRNTSVEDLAQEWIEDLTIGIADTGVKAGFIKIAMSDDGPTELEVRNLRAAAAASKVTGAAVASHTVSGSVALREMDILEGSGMNLTRFVWVHANAEPDQKIHFEVARRGGFVEFDGIGQSEQGDENQLGYTLSMVEGGYEKNILLSHDAGWYDPSHPEGKPSEQGIRGFTALISRFIPALRQRGIPESLVRLMTQTNPARAFGLELR